MYSSKGYNYKGKILRLKKALYDLKQAPLKWNIKFTNFLKEKDFEVVSSEQCLLRRINTEMVLGIYVDDGLLVGTDIHKNIIMQHNYEHNYETT